MGMGIDIGKARSEEIQLFLEDGRWYPYEDTASGASARVKIRPITPKVGRDIQKHCERWRRGQKVVDDDKFEQLLRRRMVADWEGIIIEGKPAECTKENINLLFDNCIDFAGWIIETSNEAGRELEGELVEKKANFPATSDAPADTPS